MRTKRRCATIQFDLPEDGADDDEVVSFIVEALEIWGGQRHPDDPLFSSLKVRQIRYGGAVYTNDHG